VVTSECGVINKTQRVRSPISFEHVSFYNVFFSSSPDHTPINNICPIKNLKKNPNNTCIPFDCKGMVKDEGSLIHVNL
jgi:hypothetical protein